METTAQSDTCMDVRVRVNGIARRMRMDSRVTLLDALRDELDLTGTEQGACGACTVLLEGWLFLFHGLSTLNILG